MVVVAADYDADAAYATAGDDTVAGDDAVAVIESMLSLKFEIKNKSTAKEMIFTI